MFENGKEVPYEAADAAEAEAKNPKGEGDADEASERSKCASRYSSETKR